MSTPESGPNAFLPVVAPRPSAEQIFLPTTEGQGPTSHHPSEGFMQRPILTASKGILPSELGKPRRMAPATVDPIEVAKSTISAYHDHTRRLAEAEDSHPGVID